MKQFLAAASFVFALGLHAQEAAIPGDLLVMLKPGASAAAIAQDLAKVDGTVTGLHVVREVSVPMRTWLLRFEPGTVAQQRMLGRVRAHAAVELAQNNHRLKLRAVPNDAEYGQQWQHQNIDSEAAWDITTGGLTATGDTIVVCIVENCDLPHPDLIGNAWFNYNEVPGNNIDDDNNGYVDDYRGWNAGNNNDDVYGGSHGTEVAGMIGAKGGNGSQVAGANWNVKLMAVQNTGASDEGVLASHSYPLTMRRLYDSTNGERGAFVVATNASWGIDGGQPADAPIWCAMYDTLGTAGILNCGATANNDVDIDVVNDLPTGCPSDFMISVTATNSNDIRTFSGYGLTTIDVGAPGADVFTTAIGGGTTSTSGTSFASPLTAGVIALLYSVPCTDLMDLVHADRRAAALYVRQALFSGVEQVGNLPGHTVTGGRINAGNSVQWLMDHCTGCVTPFGLSVSNVDSNAVDLGWSSISNTPVDVRYRAVGTTDWTTVSDVPASPLQVSGLAGCDTYEFEVSALCDGGTHSPFSNAFSWTTEGCCVLPAELAATRMAPTTIRLQWTGVTAATTYDIRYREVGTSAWSELDDQELQSATLEGLAVCTTYEFQVRSTCNSGPTAWSASVVRNTAGCEQCVSDAFCPSVGADASAEWIQHVTIAGVDNNSGNNEGYASFTDQTATFTIGVPTSIQLEPGYANTAYPEYFTVWMDLDRDGQFTVDERVMDQGEAMAGPYAGMITVPPATATGPIRMRVIMHYDGPVETGCVDAYDFGETEDYCATLLDNPGGIADKQATVTMQVFPVPADDRVTFTGGGADGYVQLLDAAGRAIATAPLRNGSAAFDTSALGAGAYLYRITDGAGVKARGAFVVAH